MALFCIHADLPMPALRETPALRKTVRLPCFLQTLNFVRLGEELASQLLREEDSNSLFRKLQILFSEHASKPDSRELFTFSCNAGLSPAVSLSLNPAHPSRPVQGARTHGGFVTLCTGHLEAGSPSCTRLPNTDTFLYKMLQKLTSVYITNLVRKAQVSRNCKAHSGRPKFPKILIFVQIQSFIIGNKYRELSSLKGQNQSQFIHLKNTD